MNISVSALLFLLIRVLYLCNINVITNTTFNKTFLMSINQWWYKKLCKKTKAKFWVLVTLVLWIKPGWGGGYTTRQGYWPTQVTLVVGTDLLKNATLNIAFFLKGSVALRWTVTPEATRVSPLWSHKPVCSHQLQNPKLSSLLSAHLLKDIVGADSSVKTGMYFVRVCEGFS